MAKEGLTIKKLEELRTIVELEILEIVREQLEWFDLRTEVSVKAVEILMDNDRISHEGQRVHRAVDCNIKIII